MAAEVRVERLMSVPTAVVRRDVHRADLPRVVPECCGLVWNVLKAHGVRGGRHVAVYLEHATDTSRVEIGAELLSAFAGAGDVVVSETPAGEVACAAHFGPYGGLGATHDAIGRWCAAHGRTLAGPSWEIYGHWQDAWNANPSLIRTDVYYRLAVG